LHVSHLLRSLAILFYSLGGVGLLALGFLDSSFLFLPLGNDLLVVALTAAHPQRVFYYVAMAAAGSVAGVAFTQWVSARGGQKGIEAMLKGKRAAYVEEKVRRHGGIAIATAALMPPPFPFTLFIVAAAALQYPKRKLLAIIAGSRGMRFAVDGTLALIYGRRIIRMAESARVQDFVIALVAMSVICSAVSLWTWIRKSRRRE
jgi:membrane protein YqaA with SNARE-associated domain